MLKLTYVALGVAILSGVMAFSVAASAVAPAPAVILADGPQQPPDPPFCLPPIFPCTQNSGGIKTDLWQARNSGGWALEVAVLDNWKSENVA